MRTAWQALGAIAAMGLLGACSAPASGEGARASEDLLVADDAVQGAFRVLPDRLVIAADGHEDLKALPAGKILVGKGRASRTNPDGFLRRVVSSHVEGGDLVIMTSNASLTDAIVSGEVNNRTDSPAAAASSALGELHTESVGGLLGGEFDLSGAVVLAEKEVLGGDGSIASGGIQVSTNAKVSEGYVRFTPTIDTGLVIADRQVKDFHFLAAGDLDAKIVLDIDVEAEGDLSADLSKELKPAHSKKPLFKFPRAHLPPQFVGILPVYEAVDITLNVGCDFTFKGKLHVKAGVEVQGHVDAGGRYADGQWQKMGSGPRMTITPIFDADLAGAVSAVCYLEPEADLLFYDTLGPTLAIGPYIETDIEQASGADFRWAVYPGVKAELGGDVQLFGRDIAQASLTVFDVKSDAPLAGSATAPTAP